MSRGLAASPLAVSASTRRYRAAGLVAAMAPTRRAVHSSPSAANGSAGVTYRHQPALPHLPIPSIASTASKFLDSARPFCCDPARGAPLAGEQAPNEAYSRTNAAVEEFKSSEFVKELQSRLQDHAKGKDSWLIDWFNSANYFGELSCATRGLRKC